MAPSKPPAAFKAFGTRDEQDVLGVLRHEANDIQFIRLIFPDILGRQMDFTIPASELPSAFKEGKGFDGSSIAGFVRIEESDPGPTRASPRGSAGGRRSCSATS
jgi:hypothetical protein